MCEGEVRGEVREGARRGGELARKAVYPGSRSTRRVVCAPRSARMPSPALKSACDPAEWPEAAAPRARGASFSSSRAGARAARGASFSSSRAGAYSAADEDGSDGAELSALGPLPAQARIGGGITPVLSAISRPLRRAPLASTRSSCSRATDAAIAFALSFGCVAAQAAIAAAPE